MKKWKFGILNPDDIKHLFFEEYFLETDLQERRLIKITKDGFYRIHENSIASVYIAPHSKLFFGVKIDEINIEFTDNNKMPDM